MYLSFDCTNWLGSKEIASMHISSFTHCTWVCNSELLKFRFTKNVQHCLSRPKSHCEAKPQFRSVSAGSSFSCWQMCVCARVLWVGLRNAFLCSCISLPQQPAFFGASLTIHRTCTGNSAVLWNTFIGNTRDKQEKHCFHRKHASGHHSSRVASRGVHRRIQSFTAGEEEKEVWRQRKMSENETCAFISFSPRAVFYSTNIFPSCREIYI